MAGQSSEFRVYSSLPNSKPTKLALSVWLDEGGVGGDVAARGACNSGGRRGGASAVVGCTARAPMGPRGLNGPL